MENNLAENPSCELRLYDTASHKKVPFEPLEPGKVKMYVCGPTVYNFIHVGNARTFISFDAIRRYLQWRGFDVTFVQNVTDVDDKIIARAAEEGRSASEVAADYTQAFIDDMAAVNVLEPSIRPKATEEIKAMIALISALVDKGHAYATPDGDVYFSVRSFEPYGQLSGRNLEDMQGGHRDLRTAGIEDRKAEEGDFALWKAAKPGEPAWESPWGLGRPGWHIECSAMAKTYLGDTFDIHGGGADLCFPHHENERAQSMAANEAPFAKHWMHGGMLQINSEKMSKSLGNFMLLRDVLQNVDGPTLRFLMLLTHYRSPLDYSPERLEEAKTALRRILNALENLRWAAQNATGTEDVLSAEEVNSLMASLQTNFTQAMDDDFNAPKALGDVFDYVTSANAMVAGKALSAADGKLASKLHDHLVGLLEVLGLDMEALMGASNQDWPDGVLELSCSLSGYDGANKDDAVRSLLELRAKARAQKDWGCADAIRDGLAALGLVIKDTPQGAKLEVA